MLSKCYSQLNVIIADVLTKRNISYKQFGKMCLEKFIEINGGPMYLTKSCGDRNELIRVIKGNRNITYNRFKFVMCDILKEPIPDDQEFMQIVKIGHGNDLRGLIFGRLTVIECVGPSSLKQLNWKCLCSNIVDGIEKCGNITTVKAGSLNSGHTKSCGCYGREKSIIAHTKHGKYGTSEYNIWNGMIQRCINVNYQNYKDYGGRGITVCDRWSKFENFYKDMGDRPDGMSIDRRNNNGNYEPGNCRWATLKEQANNRQNTLRFEDGMPISLWAKTNNIGYSTVLKAYKAGYSDKEILSGKRAYMDK